MLVAIISNTYKLSSSHLSSVTAIFVVDGCKFGPSLIFGLKMELLSCAGLVYGITEQSCLFPDLIWYYQCYETIMNCLHHTSAVPQPFLLLIAANFLIAGFLGWKCSLWPVPNWFAVQQSKDVFFLMLYDSINDIKLFRTVCIISQPFHSHFCCWLLPTWPKMDFWAENIAYGLCRLGWRYIRTKLYFSWYYIIINDMKHFQTFSITPQPCHSHFWFDDCCQFDP